MQFNPDLNPQIKDVLRGLHEFKKALVESNRAFTKEEFLQGLKEIGLPSNAHFWMTILRCRLPEQKCKLLTRIRKNAFVFTKPKDPIYWGDLQFIYNSYKRTIDKYSRTQKKKRSLPEMPEGFPYSVNVNPDEEKAKFGNLLEELRTSNKEENHKTEDGQLSPQIREAIDLLKSHGFEILAPVAILYTKM